MVEPERQVLVGGLQLEAVEDRKVNLSRKEADHGEHEEDSKELGALGVDLSWHPKQGQGRHEAG